MEVQRCDICNGSKKILGMGCMEKQCPTCKGVGFVEKQQQIQAQEPVPKRRRRKKEELS